MSSPIEKAAADALAAQQARDTKAARDALTAFLGGVTTTLVATAPVVFTDGTVNLSVDGDGAVRLVEKQDKQWTAVSDVLVDLAALGLALTEV